MKRFLPSTLFGRLVLVLLGGLLIAQLVGAYILLRDRASVLFEAGGFYGGQRIASIVRVLDALEPDQRRNAVRALHTPTLRVAVANDPAPLAADEGWRATRLRNVLARLLGPDRPIQVAVLDADDPTPLPVPAAERPAGHFFGMRRHAEWFPPPVEGVAFVVQVGLDDGTWAIVEQNLPPQPFSSPYKLLLALAVLLAFVIALSLLAVRWVTRPLGALGKAADELGRDINRTPLAEDGPVEVKKAAQAFNAMQQRLQRYLKERTELLAAMSHDLKTPITRLRLRAELIEDGGLRAKVLNDLEEMERMTRATLDFMRGAHATERVQPVDIDALLESLQADFEAMGHAVELKGTAAKALPGRALALRRALTNLIDNAIKYGGKATVSVEDSPKELRLIVADAGPGIPREQLERVFEPFYRLEPSRSRATGGAGLGLSIARDIARAHGGELVLSNGARGGLEALLTLPHTVSNQP